MNAIKSAGKAMPVIAPHAHDSDEIFMADPETSKRNPDLAILRALCS
jgi:hypothetical protein